jgi:hypothetical protein
LRRRGPILLPLLNLWLHQAETTPPIGVPQGVGLLADGRRAVISCGTGESPTDILIADIETGVTRRLLTVEFPGARVYAAGENFIYRKDDLRICQQA